MASEDKEKPVSLEATQFPDKMPPGEMPLDVSLEEEKSDGKLNIKRTKRKRRNSLDDKMLFDEEQAMEVGSLEQGLMSLDRTTPDCDISGKDGTNNVTEQSNQLTQDLMSLGMTTPDCDISGKDGTNNVLEHSNELTEDLMSLDTATTDCDLSGKDDTNNVSEQPNELTQESLDMTTPDCDISGKGDANNVLEQCNELTQGLDESCLNPMTSEPQEQGDSNLMDIANVGSGTNIEILGDAGKSTTVDEASLVDHLDQEKEKSTKSTKISKAKSKAGNRLVNQEILKLLPEPGIHTFTNEQLAKLRDIFKRDKEVFCPKPGCRKSYKQMLSFQYHVTRCGVHAEAIKQITCAICGKTYKSGAGYRYHVMHVHKTMGKQHDKDNANSLDTKWTAPSESFASRYGSRPRKSFVPEKQENEDNGEIGESTKWKAFMKKIDSTASGITNIDTTSEEWENQVEECMTILKNNKTKKKRVPCPKNCGYSLTMLSKLHQHLEVCTGVTRRQYQCVLCKEQKLFRSISGIKRHILVNHRKATESDDSGESEYSEGEGKQLKPQNPTVRNATGSAKYYEQKTKACDVDDYLPVRKRSPGFKIIPNTENVTDHPEFHLPLFSSTPLKSDKLLHSLNFYVGGSVWALDWVPVPVDEEEVDQYLAIGCHSDQEKQHLVQETCQEKGVLQIWCVPGLENCVNPEQQAKFCLGICYDYGPLWDIRWCPSGAWERMGKNPGHLRRLGLLALACADGKVRILSVAFPESLLEQVGEKDRTNYENLIFSVTPHAVLSPGSTRRQYRGECGPVWSVAWQPVQGHKKIIASYGDGTVAIWDLTTENPLLMLVSNGNMTQNLFPISHFQAHISAVRALTWCPSDANYIATASYDRAIKIWDLHHTSQPTTCINKGLYYNLSWPIHGASIMYSGDISLGRSFGRGTRSLEYYFDVRSKTQTPEHGTNGYIIHNSTAWLTHFVNIATEYCYCDIASFAANGRKKATQQDNEYCNWSNTLASVDATGALVMTVLGKFHTRAHAKPRRPIFRTTVEEISADDRPDTELNGPGENDENRTTKTNSENNVDILGKNDYKLVFCDTHPLLSSQAERDRLNKNLPVPDLDKPTYASLHKVRWNPNITSYNWIATAGRAGIVRICFVGKMY